MNDVTTSPAPSGLSPDRTAEMVGAVLWFVDRLVQQMFNRMLRDPRQDVAMAIHRYLRGGGRRFAAVMTRLAAGGVFRTRKSRAGDVRGERTTPRVRLPGGFGWVVRLGEEVRMSAAMIAHHLNTPEVAAMVAGCPQAQRVLRRMCWVLAIDAPCVGRVVRGRRAKSVPVARPSPRPWSASQPKPASAGEGVERKLERVKAGELSSSRPWSASQPKPANAGEGERAVGDRAVETPSPRPSPRNRGEGEGERRWLTRKERKAILWYPNLEGKPMKLLPKKLPRD